MSPAPSYTIPSLNSPTFTEEPKISTALSDLKSLLTGNLDNDNIDANADIARSKIADAEAVTVVGSGGGAPAFENSWTSVTGKQVGFWKDGLGMVHLRGAADHTSATDTTIFTLPAGYRPSLEEVFSAVGGIFVTIETTGAVVAQATSQFHHLGGVSFRAA